MKKKTKNWREIIKRRAKPAWLSFLFYLPLFCPFLFGMIIIKNNVNFNFLYEVYEISWYYLNNKKINELKFIKIKIENIFFSKINMIKYKRVSFSKNPIKSYRS
jgi:hypothetical protein